MTPTKSCMVTSSRSYFSYTACTAGSNCRTSKMQVQTAEETQVDSVHFPIVGYTFQADDGSVFLDIGRKCQANATNRLVDEAIDEKGDIRHEFAHARRIRSLNYDTLQDVGLSDAFQKRSCSWNILFKAATRIVVASTVNL